MAYGTVPVIAVTGPLGAGKTTVVNHLLRTPGARIGVVVNDFGSVNLDAALITGQVDDVASMAGGCICCAQDTDGLDAALERLTHPRLDLDVVLVEASGVAEPAVLSRMIRYSGAEHARWGGVVEVVDATRTSPTDLVKGPSVRYAPASVVVINKVDHVDRTTTSAVTKTLRALAPRAVVVRTTHGALDPDVLFDTVGHLRDDELDFGSLAPARHGHAHARSVSVPLHAPVPADALVDLLEDPPSGAIRVKGIVDVEVGRSVRPYVVHVVGGTVHVEPLRHHTDVRALVAIGYELIPSAAEERLRVAVVSTAVSSTAGTRRLRRLVRLSR